jgi:acyl-CoA thioester hydrolase
MREMPSPLLTYRGVAYPWHCDHMGHMNVVGYVGKFDEASWNLLAAIGLTGSFFRDSERAIAAVEQAISYKKELRPGDTLVIRSWIVEMREKGMSFAHEMRKADTDELAATCRQTSLLLDAATRKTAAFPSHVRDKAREFLVGTAGEKAR